MNTRILEYIFRALGLLTLIVPMWLSSYEVIPKITIPMFIGIVAIGFSFTVMGEVVKKKRQKQM